LTATTEWLRDNSRIQTARDTGERRDENGDIRGVAEHACSNREHQSAQSILFIIAIP